LLAAVEWEQPELLLGGESAPVPRLVAWYADPGICYCYSGHTHRPRPWTPLLTQIRSRIEQAARDAGLTDTGSPLYVSIFASFQRPKSHLRKSGVRPDAPKLPRPDVDNLAKACLDSLQAVMGDDTLVARLYVAKEYGTEAFTHIEVQPA
jgi:Holliday junction resolvase RusA-like endonuclease